MSEPNEGTGTPPAEPQAQPAAPPAPLEPPVPPRAPQIEADADLERVTRLYHNLNGQLQAYVTSMETYRGHLEQRLATAEQAAQVLQRRASQAEGQATQLQAQVEGLPELQEQASQVDVLQAQVDKLNLLMSFPEIVTRVVEQEVPGEEGEDPTVTRSNPTLDILLTSNLVGEEFERQVRDFARTLPTGAPQVPPPEEGATLTPRPASQADERWAEYNRLRDLNRPQEALDVLMEGMEQ